MHPSPRIYIFRRIGGRRAGRVILCVRSLRLGGKFERCFGEVGSSPRVREAVVVSSNPLMAGGGRRPFEPFCGAVPRARGKEGLRCWGRVAAGRWLWPCPGRGFEPCFGGLGRQREGWQGGVLH